MPTGSKTLPAPYNSANSGRVLGITPLAIVRHNAPQVLPFSICSSVPFSNVSANLPVTGKGVSTNGFPASANLIAVLI